jgi:hypothetical protein
MSVARDPATGELIVAYAPACDASDHTIYHGGLDGVASYAYAGAACLLGAGGSARFDPGAGDVFFFIVGNNGTVEGSYGLGLQEAERPEAIGVGSCDYPQDLSGTCDL